MQPTNEKNRINDYFSTATQQLSEKLKALHGDVIYQVTQHPGKTSAYTPYQQLKSYLLEKESITLCAGLYTLIANVTEVKPVETQQADITLQISAYLLIVSKLETLAERITLRFSLLSNMTKIINNNRWNLDYAFPATQLKRVDLYGLTVDAKQITGIKGWNPSIQAHAKDLYEENNTITTPQTLSLSLMMWEQTLRTNERITDEKAIKKIIIQNKKE